MSKSTGILLVSHIKDIADGLVTLLGQVAEDVTVKAAGGTEDGEAGTSFERISSVIDQFDEETVLCFYDLGSAKMNLELAIESSDKDLILLHTAFVESAYTAASLLEADVSIEDIKKELNDLIIKE